MRASDQLIDAQQAALPGTLTAFLEPLYEGGIDELPPGSNCIANAYTSNEESLATEGPELDAAVLLFTQLMPVGLVHAMIIRLQAVVLPVQTLVLQGH